MSNYGDINFALRSLGTLETTSGSTTTNTYAPATSVEVWDYKAHLIWIQNTHALHGVNYKIQVSPDDNDFLDIVEETDLNANSSTYWPNTNAFRYVRVTCKSGTAGSVGTVNITAILRR